jgi:2,3-dihydroxyphenylpropionate 1,2-dioxygenase
VRSTFDRFGAFIVDFAPEQIIQFSPDHFHGFLYDVMPSFCIGAAARSYGDWKTAPGPLNVDQDFALAVLHAVRDAEIDAAVSYDMVVDHGFVQVWEAAIGSYTRFPITPIFVNCIADPIPTYRRALALGRAVGRFAAQSGKRILFAASGGLSHDPVVPQIRGASPEVHARLTDKNAFGPEQQAKREIQVRAAARAAIAGGGPARPLNPGWDLDFLNIMQDADWAAMETFTTEGVDAVAGAGGNEILCWVAAAAAMAQCGRYRMVQSDYLAVDGWIAGLGHFTALPA